MSIVVSIVVPTYHRTQSVLRCLDALLSQDFEPADYEILVVDNAASEETRQAVEAWLDDVIAERSISEKVYQVSPNADKILADGTQSMATITQETLTILPEMPVVRYLAANGMRGPAAARNRGWRAAQGNIIAFTDDDCIPDPEWLRSGVHALENGYDGAYGRVIVPLPKKPTDYEKDSVGLERSEFITANCFYQRSVLELAGGFDERFTMAWREDSDLYFTLLKKGCKFIHVQSALVYHPVRSARWGISIIQQKKALFNALLYKKHPQLYRQKIQRRPPWHYYIAVTALFAAVGGLLAQESVLFWSGLLIWLLTTGTFCLTRLKGTSHHPHHVFEMVLTSIVIPPLAVYWRIRGALKFKVLFL
jgi:glycosyltransferase involved in cell wall biosynthesis